MSPRELLKKAATVHPDRFAGYDTGCFGEFVELLTAAEDGLDETPQEWTAYENFVAYLCSPNMSRIFHDLIGTDARPLAEKSAYTAQERKWMNEPRRTYPRPPILS